MKRFDQRFVEFAGHDGNSAGPLTRSAQSSDQRSRKRPVSCPGIQQIKLLPAPLKKRRHEIRYRMRCEKLTEFVPPVLAGRAKGRSASNCFAARVIFSPALYRTNFRPATRNFKCLFPDPVQCRHVLLVLRAVRLSRSAHFPATLPEGHGRRKPYFKSQARPLALQDGAHPLLVVEIPAHGLTNALFELVGGKPAQLLLDLRRVNGVAAVVARAVFDERNQLA